MKSKIFLAAALLTWTGYAFAQTEISDTDGDTKVQTEANADEDQVRILLAGKEKAVFRYNDSEHLMLELKGENNNVFIGENTGNANKLGVSNTFLGSNAGPSNITGHHNVFLGKNAGFTNTAGSQNVYIGVAAGLFALGGSNTIIGTFAGNSLTTGVGNTFIGTNSGNSFNLLDRCTFIGFMSKSSVNDITNATAIGHGALVNASNKIRLGNTAVTVIEGQVAFTTSDGRFKSKVAADAPGLDFILGLRPVTYQFDYTRFSRFLGEEEVDAAVLEKKEKEREMGFIAQEVAALCEEKGVAVSNLVHTPESEADNYSVAYGQIVVPLVKAIQEQQAQIEQQRTELAELRALLLQLAASQNQTTTPNYNLRIHPNPVRESLQIALDKVPEGATVSLVAASGELILSRAAQAQMDLGMEGLPAGIYLIQLTVPGQAPVVKTVVKQ